MSEKKKILIFIDWFLPGYKAGGPIRSVANMIDSLHDYFEFYILTSDRDLGDNIEYKGVSFNTWIKNENFSIQYLSPVTQNRKKYKEILSKTNFDSVYFNSLFSFKFTILPLLLVKKSKSLSNIVIAPRGMLGKGALKLKKTKKFIFLLITRFFGLFKNITWHATTIDEKEDIIKAFGNKHKIKIAQNIPKINNQFINKEKAAKTRFFYLSRISEKKNLHFALEIFQQININSDVYFDIYGPIEDEAYWIKCKSVISKINSNLNIEYKGSVDHNKYIETISDYHFFILPTLHENYGHVIYEALSSSSPVIISDQTPWKNLADKGIGWDINLNNKDTFIKIIQQCIEMNQKDYDILSENAFNFALKYAQSELFISETINLFE